MLCHRVEPKKKIAIPYRYENSCKHSISDTREDKTDDNELVWWTCKMGTKSEDNRLQLNVAPFWRN
jgi:hypothetical protein